MRWIFACCSAVSLLLGPASGAEGLRAGAAAREFLADDGMVIGGGIGPGKATGQEGKLRASALVLDDGHGERLPGGEAAMGSKRLYGAPIQGWFREVYLP